MIQFYGTSTHSKVAHAHTPLLFMKLTPLFNTASVRNVGDGHPTYGMHVLFAFLLCYTMSSQPSIPQ